MGGQKCPPIFLPGPFPPKFPHSSTTYFHYPQLSHSTRPNRSCTTPAYPAKCFQTKRGTVLSPLDKHRAADEIRNPFEGDCAKASGLLAFVRTFKRHLDQGCSARKNLLVRSRCGRHQNLQPRKASPPHGVQANCGSLAAHPRKAEGPGRALHALCGSGGWPGPHSFLSSRALRFAFSSIILLKATSLTEGPILATTNYSPTSTLPANI